MNDQSDILSYQTVLGGLLRMHQLFVAGKRRSEEVDKIRDDLDEPYSELSPEHRAEIEGLSKDLFDVEKIKTLEPQENAANAEVIIEEAIAVRDAGRYDRALEILRQLPGYFPFSRISFLRASIWRLKGNMAVTLFFLKHAVDLDPNNEQLRHNLQMVLDSIEATIGRSDEGSEFPGLSFSDKYIVARNTLMEIQRLRADGKGDSPKVVAALGAFKRQVEGLSAVEKKRIEGLAEDLESVESNEPVLALPPTEEAKAGLAIGLAAELRGDWDLAIEQLRKWGRYQHSPIVSFLRGKMWRLGGDLGTALVFVEHACRLVPQNVHFQTVWLNLLKQIDLQGAAKFSTDVLRSEDQWSPIIRVQAANIIHDLSRDMPHDAAELTFRTMMPVLERALKQLEQVEVDPNNLVAEGVVANMRCLGEVILASCNEQLGNPQAAYDLYTQAISRNPTDGALLAARAILPVGDRERAAQDMEAALGYGFAFSWPYVFLARHYATTGRFRDCKIICERGLKKGPTAKRIASELHEFLAMSISELDLSADAARSHFEAAVRIDPTNVRARNNFEAFKQTSSSEHGKWEEPSDQSVLEMKNDEAGTGFVRSARKMQTVGS